MSYRVDIDASLGSELRRIAGEQMEKAIEDLDDEDVHRGVHEYRKRCKKLRGLLRLVRPGLGVAAYETANRRFRDAARGLSDLRDATAKLESFDALLARYRDRVDPQPSERIHEALLERRRALARSNRLGGRLQRARRTMSDALQGLSGWKLDRDHLSMAVRGYRDNYRRARRAMGAARLERTASAFHEWRKRAKYHRYHTDLLAGLWPAVLEPWEAECDRLGEMLGNAHDLAVLRGALLGADPLGSASDGVAALLRLSEQRERELHAEALPLGERLFAEPPKKVERRLRAYAKARRAEACVAAGAARMRGQGG